MKAKGLKAACLAVGLATAWGTQADAQLDQIQLTLTPSNNLSHVYFLYGTNGSTLNVFSVVPLPDLVGGASTTETFSVDHIPWPDLAYTVVGLYDAPNKLLTIGMYDAEYFIGNSDFSSVFSWAASSYGYPFYSENAIATAMLSNDTATIMNAIDSEEAWAIPIGISGDLVNFSNASSGGSMLAQIIPEPSPILLVGLGALALLAVYRKPGHWLHFRRKRIRDP